MSAVYVVIVSNMLSEVEVCEVYAGVQSALGRAFHLATARAGNPTFVNASPEEERLEDGTVRWAFLDTNKVFVGVLFKHIEAGLNARNTRLDAVKAVPTVPAFSPQPALVLDGYQSHYHDDQMSIDVEFDEPEPVPTLNELNQMVSQSTLDFDDMPAGWFYDGRPARMKDMKKSPELVKDHVDELNEDEKWALIIARISKRCKIYKQINGFTEIMEMAIEALKNKTPVGLQIRNTELEFLDDYRQDLVNTVTF